MTRRKLSFVLFAAVALAGADDEAIDGEPLLVFAAASASVTSPWPRPKRCRRDATPVPTTPATPRRVQAGAAD